jgi:hypothetical protein
MSKQLDVLIYRIRDTPFLVNGEAVLVPCESLLAAIEIKSVLTPEEIRDGLEVAKSIRALKPFDKSFVDVRRRGDPADDNPRCLFTIFAFGTSLTEGEDWLIREGVRFMKLANELAIPPQHVDRLVVLDRGIINCAEGKGHDSARSGQSVLQIFFMHLINHLLREDRRRKEIDIDIYGGRDRWTALPGWSRPATKAVATVESRPPAQRKSRVQPPKKKRRVITGQRDTRKRGG